MNYLQLDFINLQQGESAILVALLADAGFESFEEEEEQVLHAFIREDDFKPERLKEILQLIPASYSSALIAPQNWNRQWEQSFEPILVNDFVAIRAGFHEPVKTVKHEIIITPKMSFGTGHHATTYMMIEQMQTLDFTEKTVVDFGTGTAVLAILAEKMGATAITAIDNDQWSIDNSTENAATNGCSRISLLKAETIGQGTYDLILANINLNVILDNLQAIENAAKQGSRILLSGFLKSDEPVITAALNDSGMLVLQILQKDQWICILAAKS